MAGSGSSFLLPTILVVVGAAAAVATLIAARLRRSATPRREAIGGGTAQVEGERDDAGPVELHFSRFDEAPLVEVERAFERLVAAGRIRLERPVRPSGTAHDAHGPQPPPPHVGPVYRRLLAQARAVELVEVQVSIELDRCVAAADPIGGWALAGRPDEIDVRLAPRDARFGNDAGDVVLDATWSPRGSGEIMVHSTILHFLVRSVVGDRLPS